MAKVVITGVPGLDGSYDLDLSRFTHGELRTIKQESGVRAGEVEDALRAGDADLLVALALISLRRAGRDVAPERLWDADAGTLQLDVSDEVEDDDAGPPDGTTGSAGNATANPGSSSSSSNAGGDPSPVTSIPPVTGVPV